MPLAAPDSDPNNPIYVIDLQDANIYIIFQKELSHEMDFILMICMVRYTPVLISVPHP
jgi:hypothetical protein